MMHCTDCGNLVERCTCFGSKSDAPFIPESKDEEISRLKAELEKKVRYIHAQVDELDELKAELKEARKVMNNALNELGVPQPGYPAPVGNAVEMLRDYLNRKGE